MRTDCVFPVLTCFALSCNYVSAWFKAITKESPVIVAVGDVAILRCRTSIPYELKEIRWFRTRHGHRYLINIFQDGREQRKSELPEYFDRTEVMTEDLARGRVALKLFNISVADEGAYRCYLETVYYFDFGDLELRVTALGSDPRIHVEELQDGGVKAVCRSDGWYPEPTLVNKGDGGVMEIQKEENGLYSIEYSRIITENSNRNFSCLIQTLFPDQEQVSSLYVTDDLFQGRTNTRVRIIIYPLIAALLLLLLLVVILRTRTCLRKIQDATSGASDENIHLNEA